LNTQTGEAMVLKIEGQSFDSIIAFLVDLKHHDFKKEDEPTKKK
jgi:hypothetical protein